MFHRPDKYQAFNQWTNLYLNNLDQIFSDLRSAPADKRKQCLELLCALSDSLALHINQFMLEDNSYV